jgi:methionyl-tRNA formyltransferase
MKKVIFFGSSTFSIPFIEYLTTKTQVCLVITTEDKPKDRGRKVISNAVKSYVQGKNITVISPSNLKDPVLISNISNFEPDLIIVASYGKLIPKEILQIPLYGSYNIHPSLLPYYKGADPIFWQIIKGEKKSGVTIFEMNEKIDQGDTIFQENIDISEDENYETLEDKLIKIGIKLTDELIDYIEKDTLLPHHKQEIIDTFYARKINSNDEMLNWNNNAIDIINKIKAFSPRIGSYTLLKGKRVKILKAFLENNLNDKNNARAGTIFVNGKKLIVKCRDSYLRIELLKPEGKDLMKAFDFINGYIKEDNSYFFE